MYKSKAALSNLLLLAGYVNEDNSCSSLAHRWAHTQTAFSLSPSFCSCAGVQHGVLTASNKGHQTSSIRGVGQNAEVLE